MVVSSESSLLQLQGLVLGEHAQGAADFEAEAVDLQVRADARIRLEVPREGEEREENTLWQ